MAEQSEGFGNTVRQGTERAKRSVWPIIVASIGAIIAFSISAFVLRHPQPIFAATAAWICLGFSRNRNPRKVAELGAGAALGVVTAELLMLVAGSGVWQMGVALAVAALIARFTARGELFTFQAGLTAIAVIAIGPVTEVTPVSRVIDAVVGGVVALIIAFAWPRDVTKRPRRYLRVVQSNLIRALGQTAKGLDRGDSERLVTAQSGIAATRDSIRAANDVITAAVGHAKVNPFIRQQRPKLRELRRQVGLAERTTSAVEVLIRQARGIVAASGADPSAAALVRYVRVVLVHVRAATAEWASPIPAREEATRLAAVCAPGDIEDGDWRVIMLVSVMRTITIDLLQMTGLSRYEARALLPDLGYDDEEHRDYLALDGPSALWGQDLT